MSLVFVYDEEFEITRSAPCFEGFVAIDFNDPMQHGDVLVQPYKKKSKHRTPEQGDCESVIKNIGRTAKEAFKLTSKTTWCVYRPKPKKYWVQVTSGALEEDDVVCYDFDARPETIYAGESDHGYIVEDDEGHDVEKILNIVRLGGWPGASVWRLSSENVGRRLPGNIYYSTPLTLP